MLMLNLSAFAQLYFQEDMVKVAARLIDASNNQPVPYANVLNQRVRGGTMTDTEGKFSLQADPTDTLTFKSLGYLDKKVPVSEIISQGENKAIVLFYSKTYTIGQVEVVGASKSIDIGYNNVKMSSVPLELRGEFEAKPKLMTAIFKPASFLYYKFSKTEKEKRNTLMAIRTERQWQIFSLVYNKEIAERLTGLHGDRLDDFMVYFNAYNGLNAGATTYDVEKRVKDLLAEFLAKKQP